MSETPGYVPPEAEGFSAAPQSSPGRGRVVDHLGRTEIPYIITREGNPDEVDIPEGFEVDSVVGGTVYLKKKQAQEPSGAVGPTSSGERPSVPEPPVIPPFEESAKPWQNLPPIGPSPDYQARVDEIVNRPEDQPLVEPLAPPKIEVPQIDVLPPPPAPEPEKVEPPVPPADEVVEVPTDLSPPPGDEDVPTVVEPPAPPDDLDALDDEPAVPEKKFKWYNPSTWRNRRKGKEQAPPLGDADAPFVDEPPAPPTAEPIGPEESLPPVPPAPETPKPLDEAEDAIEEGLDARHQAEMQRDQLPPDWMEQLQNPDTRPEMVVKLASLLSPKEYQQWQIFKEKGRRTGKLEQILAGDLNFELNADGQVKHKWWREAIQRGARIFDKKVMLGAGLYAVVGLISGFGIPGAATLAGGVAGRAGAEIVGAIKGKERQSEAVKAEQMSLDYKELIKLAGECQDEGLSPEEKAQKMSEAIARLYGQSEDMLQARAGLAQEQGAAQKSRDKWGKIGAIAGFGTGLAAGLTGLTNMIQGGNMDFQGLRHDMRLIGGHWKFAQTAAEHAVSETHHHAFGQSWHQLGGFGYAAEAWTNVAAGVLAVVGGTRLGGWAQRRRATSEAAQAEAGAAALAEQGNAMLGQIAAENQPPETPEGPTEPVSTGGEGGGGGADVMAPETPENPAPASLEAMAEKYGQAVPQEGELWVYEAKDQNNQTIRRVFKITKINANLLNPAATTIKVNEMNPDDPKLIVNNTLPDIGFEDFISHAKKR